MVVLLIYLIIASFWMICLVYDYRIEANSHKLLTYFFSFLAALFWLPVGIYILYEHRR